MGPVALLRVNHREPGIAILANHEGFLLHDRARELHSNRDFIGKIRTKKQSPNAPSCIDLAAFRCL
jgi:hypothetical protein